MAKRPKVDDDQVAVWVGSRFKHYDRYLVPHEIVYMTRAEAADLVALRRVRYATAEEAAS